MSLRKCIILGGFILALLALVLIAIGVTNMRPERALNNFSRIVEQGNIENISLTIYYINPNIFTPFAISVSDLRRNANEIVVEGNDLKEYIDLFSQINSDVLIFYEHEESILDARIYYVFRRGNRKIFDVAMWGGYDEASIFINGIEFKMNNIFVEIIIPFMPEHLAENLKGWIEN